MKLMILLPLITIMTIFLGCEAPETDSKQKSVGSSSKADPALSVSLAGWQDYVEEQRGKVSGAKEEGLQKLCQEAKDTAERMKSKNYHVDIGLGIDILDPKSYAKARFSNDVVWTSMITQEYLQCFENDNSCTGVKHFPGIGGLDKDPHQEISHQVFQIEDHRKKDLKPFVTATKAGACMMMSTHIFLKINEQSDTICTFDKDCIALLRDELGYDGVIITDEILVMDATLDAMLDILYKPANEEGLSKPWDQMVRLDKQDYIFEKMAAEKCPTESSCTDDEIAKLMDDLDDKNGLQRTILSLKAGNDLILQFRAPGHIYPVKQGLEEVINGVVKAIEDGTLSMGQIDSSVKRVLLLKEKYFGDQLYAKFPNSGSVDAILQELTTAEKVAQLIAIDGRYGFYSFADSLGLGAAYIPDEGITSTKAKIPLLHLADHEYAGSNKTWGKTIGAPQ